MFHPVLVNLGVPPDGAMFLQVPDGFDHAEAHFHTAVGVVLPGLGEA